MMKYLNISTILILVVVATIALPWYLAPNEPYYDIVDTKEYLSFEDANSLLVKPLNEDNDYYYTESRTYEKKRGKFPFVYDKKQITKTPRSYWSSSKK